MQVRTNLIESMLQGYRARILSEGLDNSKTNEKYKWEIITKCQGTSTSGILDVLLSSQCNFIEKPHGGSTISQLIKDGRKEELCEIFDILRQNKVLADRIVEFSNAAKSITPQNRAPFGDERTAAAFLSCIDPQQYTPYTYTIYSKYCQYLGERTKTSIGEKYQHFLDLLDEVRSFEERDTELIGKLREDTKGLVWSDLLNAQDVLWQMQDYFTESKSSNPSTHKSDSTIDRYINLLKANYNLILTGAPGTGKTYLAKSIAKAMGATEENGNVKMVQFHPSYDYTDFVEGLRPKKDGDGFERVDGVFKSFCAKASTSQEAHVFIIDEINRGELSKIFGELFFSIDPGYRGTAGRVETQYQNMVEVGDPFYKGFYVPENVYIIGTMNDIDRGVESMDFAIRRRFAWKEVTAESGKEMLEKNIPDLAERAKESMKALNEAIEKKDGLSSAYHIGPAYYLKLLNYKGSEKDPFECLWEHHIKGLIFEYLRGTRDAAKTLESLKTSFDKYKEE